MNYKLGNKTIKIPDTEIEVSMKNLDLTKEEAIQMWLEDEGYLDNEEQVELTAKAKASKIMQTIHGAESEDRKIKRPKEKELKKKTQKKPQLFRKLQKFFQKLRKMSKLPMKLR